MLTELPRTKRQFAAPSITLPAPGVMPVKYTSVVSATAASLSLVGAPAPRPWRVPGSAGATRRVVTVVASIAAAFCVAGALRGVVEEGCLQRHRLGVAVLGLASCSTEPPKLKSGEF